MIEKKLADKLVGIAVQQMDAGIKLKKDRMKRVLEIEELYNNKVVQIEEGRSNIPFPIMSGQLDTLKSKIDNPPTVSFKIPNRLQVSEKIAAAWKMDSSSMRAGWPRKDRNEKNNALFSGRGISSIFASSVNNKYKSHYNVVDHFSFICEGNRSHLEDQLYCGETDIWKTKAMVEQMADDGVYDKNQIRMLVANTSDNSKTLTEQNQNKVSRYESMDLDPRSNGYVGQTAFSLVQWNMDYRGERYYLLFDPLTKLWIRAEKLQKMLGHKLWMYNSWATNEDSNVFWSKGPGDDILPIAEAIRILLNEVIENQRRRNRPMRIVKGGDFPNVNELMDYIPDNVIVTNRGKDNSIVDINTPEITVSVDLVQYLNNFMAEKTGISGPGVDEKDAKVGVFFGQLQQEADRIGIINKAYSEGYAEKAYRYFWGLKMNLTEKKSIEMLGKGGIQWAELEKTELSDVDDVDDIITSGGSREEQLNAITQKTQADTIAAITANPLTAQELSARWLTRSLLKSAGYTDEDVQAALDKDGDANRDLMNEADQAIQEILLGKTPDLNRAANAAFMQRILDFDVDNLNWIKLDKDGNEIGVNKKIKEDHDKLMKYMFAHQEIVVQNQQRELRDEAVKMATPMGKEQGTGGAVRPPEGTQRQEQANIAQPFENPQGTPSGTAEVSQDISQTLSP